MNNSDNIKALCKIHNMPICNLEKDLGRAKGYITHVKDGIRLREINQICNTLFVNKHKEYKDKQNEIKVGDVVQLAVKEAIVTAIDGCNMYLLYRDGISNKFTKDNFTKTGKHYDSIDKFMNS